MKSEYKVVYIDIDGQIEEILNDVAKENWDLVFVIPPMTNTHRSVFIFERYT